MSRALATPPAHPTTARTPIHHAPAIAPHAVPVADEVSFEVDWDDPELIEALNTIDFGVKARVASSPHHILVDAAMRAEADGVLERRAALPASSKSRNRWSSTNLRAQRRGALSELGAARWLVQAGWSVRRGFLDDATGEHDITVLVDGLPRWGIEVMGAQAAHRALTGACVPPDKARSAANRRKVPLLGYLFVSYGPEPVPDALCIDGFAWIAEVRGAPVRFTEVGSRGCLNHVIPLEALHRPEALLSAMARAAGGLRR
jgi:hypothetical protein